jgi:hypothetical protein|tara:strand:- start:831 stop:1655 length:825 start_codon:yes stop_codon:yes gene_type:complete
MRLGGARPGAGTTVGKDGLGPGKGPDNNKNKVTPDPQPSAEDIYGVSPNLDLATKKQQTPTKSGFGLGFLSNLKDLGEKAFIDRYSNYTDNPEVARLASIKANVSPGDLIGGLMSLAQNPLGTGYGIASTETMTGFNPAALASLGFTGTLAGLLGQTFSNNPVDLANPSNYAMAAPGAPMQYTGPVGHFNTAQISQLENIQGGLTLDQQADIAISQFEKEQAEKNARPGALVQPTEQFVNPVESKFTEEQLRAYNEYIARGYPPEIAEYLATKA